MKINELTTHLESIAPLALQESYDNAGLIIGDSASEITGVLICLDSTEEIINEAIQHGCNLIIAHHPIIFGGLKKLNGVNYVERTVIKAIRNHISIYAAHTNLDNILQGVNMKFAEKLGLQNTQVLLKKKGLLKKLITFCPVDHAEKVRLALFEAGSGQIGNYDSCSFNSEGMGTFRGGEKTNPFVGKMGEFRSENEIRIETIFESWKETKVLKALFNTHPYEEVAYDIYSLDNYFESIGSGLIGYLPIPLMPVAFIEHLKKTMKVPMIRHTSLINNKIEKIALCGGSGSFLLEEAIRHEAQIFITADFKYHQFFDANRKIMIADIGHFESEQYTMELIQELILKKNPTFTVRLTEVNTNPVHYS